MNKEQEFFVEVLRNAINAVYQEERFLFRFTTGNKGGLEQAFVFRTGIHLSNSLKGTPYAALDLDSEYNKNHGNAKTSANFPKGLRPDLIIHQRDSHGENKLVVEFKGFWETVLDKDIKKLEDLTDPNDNYHYLIGVFVHIGRTEATFRYFINGVEHE